MIWLGNKPENAQVLQRTTTKAATTTKKFFRKEIEILKLFEKIFYILELAISLFFKSVRSLNLNF